MPWLVRDDDVLAVAEVAATRGDRRRGLRGRDGCEGALVLRPCRQVHTFGMRFALDVAFCDGDGVVIRTVTLRTWRVSPLIWASRFAVEAEAGSFERWQLRAGDHVEVR